MISFSIELSVEFVPDAVSLEVVLCGDSVSLDEDVVPVEDAYALAVEFVIYAVAFDL